MQMLASRNQTSHTYNKETVEDICGAIGEDYASAFANFQKTMANLRNQMP